MRVFDVRSLGEVAFEAPPAQVTRADVAVIIPLYNYGLYIVDCLQSVVDQTLEHVSVVVVDDCSTDDGLALVIDFLKANAARFSSARVIRHIRNQGPSMARNSGIAWSDEPLLFMLDADNRIRPPALARLKAALDVSGADFAYSQTFIFGEQTDIGPADIWHVDRLRYGNTIDALALIRRTALKKAGGYAQSAVEHGWEDYDLWCRFFTLGLRGVFVPELLCEYRRHGTSITNSRTKKKLPSLEAEMALRYPDIFHREARTPTIDQDLSVSLPLDYKFKLMTNPPTVAVVIHMFYPKMIDQIIKYVMNIPLNVSIYISTDSIEKKLSIEERLRCLNVAAELRVTALQGRDIAPRLLGFRDVYENNDYTLLLHSKASLHDPELKDWGKYLFESLLGSGSVVESIFAIFDEAPEVGLIAAQHFEPVRKNLGWGENFELCEALAGRFGVDLKANGFLDFPTGSMLWARTAALRPFFDAGLVLGDFSADHVGRQIDGTMAHAIERLFFVAAERAGFSWIKVAQPHLFERQDTIKRISDPVELHQFVAKQRRILASHGRRTGVGGSTFWPAYLYA